MIQARLGLDQLQHGLRVHREGERLAAALAIQKQIGPHMQMQKRLAGNYAGLAGALAYRALHLPDRQAVLLGQILA